MSVVTTGVCKHCKKHNKGAECSFLVFKSGKKTVYMCESCGKAYTKKPRKA